MRTGALVPLAGIVAACASTAAYAQHVADPHVPPVAASPASDAGQPASSPATHSGDALQEIVVTAQRREQNLLSVPLSIQAETGRQLSDSGIRDLSQIQFSAPGVSSNAGFGYTQVFIRGVGNNIYVGADPSVATYIDDVPRTFGTLQSNLVNVERVEVLKGAQGGLYGRNATGGVVNIITRQPGDKFAAEGRVLYGEKDTVKGSLYVNVPLSDDVAWNISAERDSHDYYVDDVARKNPYSAANFPNGSYLGTPQQTADFFNSAAKPPRGVGDQDFWSVDSKLRARVGDLKLTLAGDYSRKQDSSGAAVVNLTPGLVQETAQALLAAYGIDAVLPPGFYQSTDKKFATTYSYGEPKVDLLDYGGSLTAVYALPFADLTSISSYRRQFSDYFADGPYGNPPLVPEHVQIHKRAFYQELRLVGHDSGRWHYLAGATYLTTQFDGRTDVSYLPPFPLLTPTLVRTKVHNWSVYGQLGYDLTEKLNLTVSGRYIHETNTTTFTSPLDSSADISESKFLPSAYLTYKLAGGGNVYARWARGIKAGGINPVVPPSEFPTPFGSVFGPEKVDTYEVGYRDTLFDRKVQVTAAAFYNDYSDLHAFTSGNADHIAIIQAYLNAGTARTWGFEGSINWRVAPPVTVGVNAGYLNAKYKSFKNTDDRVLNAFDYSGQTMIYSPKWQFNFNANLDQPLNDRFSLIGSALASYTSSQDMALSAIPGIPNDIAPSYWIVNLRAGVKTGDDKYELAVFANNAFNEGYYVVGSHSSLGNVLGWGDPRIVGVELRVKY